MLKNLAAYLYLLIVLFVISGCSNELIQPVSNINDEEIDADEISQENASSAMMRVHYIDVGQADATLLQVSEKNEDFTILIDTGNWNETDVVTYLQTENIRDIDIIAITHPHADHIGQLDKIIDAFNVTEVWMNGEIANSQVFAKSLDAIEKNHVDYYEPKVGDAFDIGPLQIEVLHPKSITANTNNNSLAMRMQYGEIAFLFTGDGEEQAEREMLASGEKLQADILHVGHHGSKSSTSEEFLKAVNPEIAIYSAGVGNSYGHPDSEVTDRINSSEILLYGTDIHGTIIVDTDGIAFNVRTHEQGTLPRDSSNGSCVDINKASEKEVQRIKHIGPASALELIKLRPYHSVDDLVKINGIGPVRVKDIKEQGIACIGG